MFRYLAIAVVCTLLLIPIAGYGSNIISNVGLLIAFTFGLGYVALPALLLKLWPTKVDRAVDQPMSIALAEGNLVTTDYEATMVAELELDDIEDEGHHFLFAAAGGKTLYLAGEYVDQLVERGRFPAKRFRVFSNRVTGIVYGVEPIGEVIDAWPVYGKLTRPADELLDNGRWYEQPMKELIEELGGQEIRPVR
jgi:hypothetical protein